MNYPRNYHNFLRDNFEPFFTLHIFGYKYWNYLLDSLDDFL